MTYQSVWWHNPVEHGAGFQPNRTWPSVMEQYRRPKDERHYDLPTENYESKLYYERTHLAKPIYRGLFRDKPHTVTSYYPGGIDNKPRGFHGRLYYEQENPRFKYEGRPKNDLYWLENAPYRPVYPREGMIYRNDEPKMPEISTTVTNRKGNKTPIITPNIGSAGGNAVGRPRVFSHSYNLSNEELLQTYREPSGQHGTNRLTLDGPGYL